MRCATTRASRTLPVGCQPLLSALLLERIGLDGCHVHDPSAIAYVIDPTLFTLREGPVRVINEGPAIGHTLQKFDGKSHPTTAGPIIAPSRWGVAVRIRRCWRSIGRRWWPGAAAARGLSEQGGLRPGLEARL